MKSLGTAACWILAVATLLLAANYGIEAAQTASIPINSDLDIADQPFLVLDSVLRGTGVSAGVAQIETCSDSLQAHLKVKRGTTIGEAMDAFVASNPSYRWRLDGDVLNLLPTTEFPLLNIKIHSFEFAAPDNNMTEAILHDLLNLPEVRQREAELNLKAALGQGGPGVVDEHPVPRKPVPIHLGFKDVTLQEAFNSVVRAHGHTMWIYSERHCKEEVIYSVQSTSD